MNSYSFAECWERILQKTSIENYAQLAEIIGISKSNITKRKDENLFPVEWAFLVAENFGLTTEWILKGKEVQKNELRGKGRKFEIFNDAEEWLDEQIRENPNRKAWFELHFLDSFPGFKEWREKRDAALLEGTGFKKQANGGGGI